MPSTLDVSFLAKPDVSRPIIYRYRDGLLVPRVRSKIWELLQRNDCGFRATTADTLLQNMRHAGLFDDYLTFFEWPKERSRKLGALADDFLEALREGVLRKFVLFAPASANIFDNTGWPTAAARCLIVEEPGVAPASLSAIMKHYWSVTDLPCCPLDCDAVERQLLAMQYDKRYPALGEFLAAMDRLMLLHYEVDSGSFSKSCLVNESAAERSSILRPLRRLLNNDVRAIEDLVEGLEIKLRRRLLSIDEIATQMFELACDLLHEVRGQEERELAGCHADWPKFLWAVTCLVGLPRLLQAAHAMQERAAEQPEPFLAQFDLLARDFQRRLNGEDGNPFPDWWLALDDALDLFARGSDRPWPSREERLLLALNTSLATVEYETYKPSWVRRLTTGVQRAAEARQRQPTVLGVAS